MDELTVENAFLKSFDGQLRRQLDPYWEWLGPKTKRIVEDLKTLRHLLVYG